MLRQRGLKTYQDELLKMMDAARVEGATEQEAYFGFVSNGQHYLIDAACVDLVTLRLNLLPIPLSKPWVAGAANVRGAVRCVVDFSVMMGGSKTLGGKFMVLSDEMMPGAALLIQGNTRLIKEELVSAACVSASEPLEAEWLSKSCVIDGVQYKIIDAEALTSDARFSKLQNGDVV